MRANFQVQVSVEERYLTLSFARPDVIDTGLLDWELRHQRKCGGMNRGTGN